MKDEKESMEGEKSDEIVGYLVPVQYMLVQYVTGTLSY